MPATEFLKSFRKTTDAFDWKYLDEVRIRGFLKQDASGKAFSPIDAVLFLAGDAEERAHGSDILGLSPIEHETVIRAANGQLWLSVEGDRALDGYAVWLRHQMALAVGLDPEEAFEPADRMAPETLGHSTRWVPESDRVSRHA